jgi:hypothetical protein
VISSHFILHQHTLSLKLLPYLQDVLDVVVEAVSLIEERALNHCMFNVPFKEVWSQYTILLLHTKVLTRAFGLQDLIEMFLHEKGLILHFAEPKSAISLA